MSQTAETVFQSFVKLASKERARFYCLLVEKGVGHENVRYEDVFGHLAEADFISKDAAEYLDVSPATFQRHVNAGRIQPLSPIGKSNLFSASELKIFKRSLKEGEKHVARDVRVSGR